MLKRLSVHALRTFNQEVKAGERQALTTDELTERTETALEEILKKGLEKEEGKASLEDGKSKSKKPAKGRDTGVKQTKIVRQNERVDPLTGKGRSKGYGFVEMTKHADALKVLRWANNNPAVTPLFKEWFKEELGDYLKREKAKGEEKDEARMQRIKEEIEAGMPTTKGEKGTLIVEFSIENIQVVQRRAQSMAGGKKVKDEGAADEVCFDLLISVRGLNNTIQEPPRKGKGKDTSSKPPNKRPKRDDDRSEAGGSPQKRRRVEKKSEAPASSQAPEKDKKSSEKPKKAFNPVGAVIGRKRKERKVGKKGKA